MRYTFQFSDYLSNKIPKTRFTEFDLSDQNLNFYPHRGSAVRYEQIIQAIPTNYDTLNLTNCSLQRTLLLQSIPAHITRLILSKNHFGSKGNEQFNAMLNHIPVHIQHLDLSQDDLSTLSANSIWHLLSRFSSVKVVHANLDIGALNTIVSTGQTLPYLNHLDLTANDFQQMDLNNLIGFISACPALITLNLSCNDLGGWTSENRIRLIQSLSNITVLDLTNNGLWRWGAQGFIDAMRVMSENLHTLILDNNQLQSLPHLIDVFLNIPSQIHYLSLNRNYFGALPKETVITLMQALPPHLKMISLNNSSLSSNKNKKEQERFKASLISTHPQCEWRFPLNFGGSDLSHLLLVFAGSRRAHMYSLLESLPLELTVVIMSYLIPKDTASPALFALLKSIVSWVPAYDQDGRFSNLPVPEHNMQISSLFESSRAICSSVVDQHQPPPAPPPLAPPPPPPAPPVPQPPRHEKRVLRALLVLVSSALAAVFLGTGFAIAVFIVGAAALTAGYFFDNRETGHLATL